MRSDPVNADDGRFWLGKRSNLILAAMGDADASIFMLNQAVEYEQGTIICEADEVGTYTVPAQLRAFLNLDAPGRHGD